MKEIIAIIQPRKWEAVKARLADLGISSFTTSRVYGRGRQKGLHYPSPAGGTAGLSMMPKRILWLWLGENQVKSVVEAVIEVSRTGTIGDGKIFVCPADDIVRLRTGEHGDLAVT